MINPAFVAMLCNDGLDTCCPVVCMVVGCDTVPGPTTSATAMSVFQNCQALWTIIDFSMDTCVA